MSDVPSTTRPRYRQYAPATKQSATYAWKWKSIAALTYGQGANATIAIPSASNNGACRLRASPRSRKRRTIQTRAIASAPRLKVAWISLSASGEFQIAKTGAISQRIRAK